MAPVPPVVGWKPVQRTHRTPLLKPLLVIDACQYTSSETASPPSSLVFSDSPENKISCNAASVVADLLVNLGT